MRGSKTLACGLAVLLAATGTALAARSNTGTSRTPRPKTTRTPQPTPKQEKEVRLSGEYAQVAEELGLTEAQKRGMASRIEAKEKAVAAWDQQNGKRQSALKEKLSQAERDKKTGLIPSLQAQLDAIDKARARVVAAGDARVMAGLSPEQRATWEAKKLRQEALVQLRNPRLTDAQEAAVGQLCKQAAAQTAKAGPDGRDKILSQLVAAIQKTVLKETDTADKDKKSTRTKASDEEKSYGRDKKKERGGF